MNLKRILRIVSAPLVVGVIYGLYYLAWRAFGLPSQDELVIQLEHWFDLYGLWIVFFGAVIEGILLAGNYFPGGVIIFLGVIIADDNIPLVVATVAVVSLSFFFSYLINYVLGRYGWYRLLVKFGLQEEMRKAQARVERRSFTAILLSYWQPNLAAITSTAAGVLALPMKRFWWQSGVGILIWNAFWGVTVYVLHEQALDIITNFKLIIPVLAVWVAALLLWEFIKHRRKVESS